MWYTVQSPEGLENLPFLQVLGGDASAESCSDGEPSAQSRSRNTREMSFCNGRETESSTHSRSGMMLEHSTESRGAEKSMSSAEDFLVKTLVVPEKASALEKVLGADYGESMRGLFAKYDHATASWKTAQCSLLEGLDSFSETWPRLGMMLRGRCYRLKSAVRLTNGKECGLSRKTPDGMTFFHTPTCVGLNGGSNSWRALKKRILLNATLTNEEKAEAIERCKVERGGKANPEWLEWLMGWPLGWSGLKPLEMGKFLSWRRLHSVNWSMLWKKG